MGKKDVDAKPSSLKLEDKWINPTAALASSIFGLFAFYPNDTRTKRIQNQQNDTRTKRIQNQQLVNKSSIPKVPPPEPSSYRGFGFAGGLYALHKVLKYAGQPVITKSLDEAFPGQSPVVKNAIGGGTTGIIEAGLLSRLNTLKTLRQLDLENRSYRELWKADTNLSRSTWITLIRNAKASAAFFAVDSLLHQWYEIPEGAPLSYEQVIMTSIACPAAAEFVSYPADTIKTIIQGNPKSPGIIPVFKSLVKEEGVRGLYKGLGPKLFFIFPRSGMSYGVYQITRDLLKQASDSPEPLTLSNKNTR